VLKRSFAADRYSVDNLLFLPASFFSLKVRPLVFDNVALMDVQSRKWSFTSGSVHESITAFHFAERTHNDQFMSQEATHEVLNDRWYGDLSSESSLLWVCGCGHVSFSHVGQIMLVILCPFFLLWTPFNADEIYDDNTPHYISLRRRIKKMMRAPITRSSLTRLLFLLTPLGTAWTSYATRRFSFSTRL
jgi:hypothetical protein